MDTKPKKGEYLEAILRCPKTVFTSKDVSLLWGEENDDVIKKRLNKYVKVGKLIRVRRGIYVKDINYNQYELATRIYTPAYISFETVLSRKGVNFQYYGNIFVSSYINREITVNNQKITFVRMKDYVLSNSTGIEHIDGVDIASRERAFLDRLYVSKDYHFDNLDSLNWDNVMEILPIYNNKRLEKTIKQYSKNI